MAGYRVRSLAELGQTARGFFTQSVQGAIASVWANTFTVVAKVLALLDFEHELRRAWLFRQIFASTADEVWLARHAFEFGLGRTPASPAVGTVTLAATPGTVVPSGLSLLRGDGLTFTTVAGATAAGNSVTLPVEADLAGAVGNTDPGSTLTLDAGIAIPGLSAQGVVDPSGLTAGADAEPLETLRARVLARKRKPPQGGSAPDYEEWVREALPNVLGVWVDSFVNDARSVWIMFTVVPPGIDPADPAALLEAVLADPTSIIPTSEQAALVVQGYIDDPIRRPVTARVFALAPTPAPIPITIGGLVPDTPDVRAAVEAELAAVFVDRARPSKPSAPFTLGYDWLDEAISRATGEDTHDLLVPAADLTFGVGVMPVLGPVTYTS